MTSLTPTSRSQSNFGSLFSMYKSWHISSSKRKTFQRLYFVGYFQFNFHLLTPSLSSDLCLPLQVFRSNVLCFILFDFILCVIAYLCVPLLIVRQALDSSGRNSIEWWTAGWMDGWIDEELDITIFDCTVSGELFISLNFPSIMEGKMSKHIVPYTWLIVEQWANPPSITVGSLIVCLCVTRNKLS